MLKTYQGFIDIPQDGDWENISVETVTAEAESPEEAREKISTDAEKKYDDFYVWEISEDDVIFEE